MVRWLGKAIRRWCWKREQIKLSHCVASGEDVVVVEEACARAVFVARAGGGMLGGPPRADGRRDGRGRDQQGGRARERMVVAARCGERAANGNQQGPRAHVLSQDSTRTSRWEGRWRWPAHAR